MTNRARIYNPYPLDMFSHLETGTRGTFTDEDAPVGCYIFTPDGGKPVTIPEREFDAHFICVVQATIF